MDYTLQYDTSSKKQEKAYRYIIQIIDKILKCVYFNSRTMRGSCGPFSPFTYGRVSMELSLIDLKAFHRKEFESRKQNNQKYFHLEQWPTGDRGMNGDRSQRTSNY
jgi:hypothetical protein